MNSSYRQVRAYLLAFALTILPFPVAAQVLEVELLGLEGELRKNALAWLGDPPDTALARSNYLHSARDKVTGSLQALGYYRPEIALRLDRDQEPWKLNIEVDPGEPVRLRHIDIAVSGEAAQDRVFSDYLRDTGLKAGDVLNHQAYDGVRRRLTSLGLQRGYFDGVFTSSQVSVEAIGGTADIQLHYDSGARYRFGELSYDRENFAARLVEPLVAAKQGEPYDQSRLGQSQVQLQRTGYFSTVILNPDLKSASDGTVPLNLQLYPAKRHNFDVGIGYSTDTEERLTLTWRTPRINRWGHSQETRLQYSKINPSGRVTYSIPMSHPLNDTLQFWARLEDNEFGDLDSLQKELAGRREFKRGNWVYSFSLRGLQERWDVVGESFKGEYLLPGFSISQRLRKGNLVNPESGFSHWYRFEGAGDEFGSDIDLFRVTANYGFIHTIAERHRLVLRSNLGIAIVPESQREDLAPSLGFFTGGADSIRGYGYLSIGKEITAVNAEGKQVNVVVGGERLATASAEYQYRFTETWRGAVFIDGGDAFDEEQFDFNGGAGLGVHYLSPVGAIRFEVANAFTEDDPSWRIHLAMGAEF